MFFRFHARFTGEELHPSGSHQCRISDQQETTMLVAITRQVSPAINRCELTHLARTSIDFERAVQQHETYEHTLASLGCDVHALPPGPDLPDSVFVEDTAIVLDEVAVITRPGAKSRRPEIPSIAAVLRTYRPLAEITDPGTLDGGDVLRLGRHVYVGISGRTNQAAVQQLQTLLKPFGYSVIGVPVQGCLHLKSAVTQVAPDTILINPAWVSAELFFGAIATLRCLHVAPGEDYAANALLVGGSIVYPTSFQNTGEMLESSGMRVCRVDVSELQKAEGAVTCCSLLFATT
jgi:dimethylargininase